VVFGRVFVLFFFFFFFFTQKNRFIYENVNVKD